MAHLSVLATWGGWNPILLATGLPWRHSSIGHIWLLGTSVPAQKCWRSGSVGLSGGSETSCPARSIKRTFDKATLTLNFKAYHQSPAFQGFSWLIGL